MALIRPNPPLEVVKALNDGLDDEEITLFNSEEVLWLPIYTIPLRTLVENMPSSKGQPLGWQFFARDSNKELVEGEVNFAPGGGKPVMTSVSQELEVADYFGFAVDVGKLPELEAMNSELPNYELRLLRVPELHTEAFWLRSPTGAGDLMVPFHSFAMEFKLMNAYPRETFLNILSPQAARLSASKDSPPPKYSGDRPQAPKRR